MKASGFVIASILAFSALAIAFQQSASAESIVSVGGIEQLIWVTYVDGQTIPINNYKEFPLGTLLSTQGKEVVSLKFEARAIFYTNNLKVTGSTLTLQQVQISMPDGTMKALPVEGGAIIERANPQSNSVWVLYRSVISASTIEDVIGSSIYDYDGAITMSTSEVSVKVKPVTGSGSEQTYTVPAQVVTFPFSLKGTGGIATDPMVLGMIGIGGAGSAVTAIMLKKRKA